MKISELENGKYYKYINSLGYTYLYHFNYYEKDEFGRFELYYYCQVIIDGFILSNVRYGDNESSNFKNNVELEEIEIEEILKYLPKNHPITIKFRKERIDKLLCK